MSQSHCSPVVAISDRQSNRLQNRFDLIQIICYMKFMFVNICKIGLLVLVVQPKQMVNTVRRYSLHITKQPHSSRRASNERPYFTNGKRRLAIVGRKNYNNVTLGKYSCLYIKLSTRIGNGGSPARRATASCL